MPPTSVWATKRACMPQLREGNQGESSRDPISQGDALPPDDVRYTLTAYTVSERMCRCLRRLRPTRMGQQAFLSRIASLGAALFGTNVHIPDRQLEALTS